MTVRRIISMRVITKAKPRGGDERVGFFMTRQMGCGWIFGWRECDDTATRYAQSKKHGRGGNSNENFGEGGVFGRVVEGGISNIEHRTLNIERRKKKKEKKGFGFTAETRRSLGNAKFFEVKRNAEGSEVAEGDAEK
jgi:hypothetical protein